MNKNHGHHQGRCRSVFPVIRRDDGRHYVLLLQDARSSWTGFSPDDPLVRAINPGDFLEKAAGIVLLGNGEGMRFLARCSSKRHVGLFGRETVMAIGGYEALGQEIRLLDESPVSPAA